MNHKDVKLECNQGLFSICDRKPSRCCLRPRSCCSEDVPSSMVTSSFVSCGPGEEDQTSKNDFIVSIPASIMSFGKSLPMWSNNSSVWVYKWIYADQPSLKSSNSWAFFLASWRVLNPIVFLKKIESCFTLTTSSGNLASCATWIPKLWSEIPTVVSQ